MTVKIIEKIKNNEVQCLKIIIISVMNRARSAACDVNEQINIVTFFYFAPVPSTRCRRWYYRTRFAL